MRKVLIITYYWPPAGGPGVQRVLKFVAALPRLGWYPIVLTVKNPVSSAYDQGLRDKIPKKCKVYKTKTLEPFTLYKKFTGKKDNTIPKDAISWKERLTLRAKLSRWIRANVFIPDARVGWIPYMVKEGLKIIEKEKPEIIFSTSPPHSLQIGAKKLSKKTGLPWIADLRDPWAEAYWQIDLHSAIVKKINTWLEKRTLSKAKLVTTVSDGFIEQYTHRLKVNTKSIFNGFEYLNEVNLPSARFTIFFVGNLSKYQSPEPVFAAIDMLPEDIKVHIDIVFAGKVFDDFHSFKDKFPNLNIIFREYMAYDDLKVYAQSVTLLLLIIHNISYTKEYMTAKIFDYLAFRKPILAIGEPGSVLAGVLTETESGKLFNYSSINEIREYILNNYQQWMQNKTVLLKNNNKLNKYSTEENVKKLINLFEEVRI